MPAVDCGAFMPPKRRPMNPVGAGAGVVFAAALLLLLLVATEDTFAAAVLPATGVLVLAVFAPSGLVVVFAAPVVVARVLVTVAMWMIPFLSVWHAGSGESRGGICRKKPDVLGSITWGDHRN